MTATHPTVGISLTDMSEPVNCWGGVLARRVRLTLPHPPLSVSLLNEIEAQDMGTHEWHDPQLMGCSAHHTVPIS